MIKPFWQHDWQRCSRRGLLDFLDWKSKLVNDPEIKNGETTFPGTRITVQGIAGVLERGEAREHVLEDFPSLTGRDLDHAQLYVNIYGPKEPSKKNE